jgi:hypothetical protein
MIQAPIRFFLGANTPGGFRDTAQELYDPREGWWAYLIKSGPGTGKSTLLRRIYEEAEEKGEEAEVFCCSGDPSSLDGVRLPGRRVCVLDATAPHVIEPRYWGACEQIVPLSVCGDEQVIYEQREAFYAAAEKHRAAHARCRRFLAGAASLLSENMRVQRNALDEEGVCRCAARLATKEFASCEGTGQEQRRFLSAVTPEGVVPLFETVQALCPRIYVIMDDIGAAASLLLRELQKHTSGQDRILCCCPLSPDSKAEHLLFPAAGVAFITANEYHPVDFPVYRRIHASRFVDGDLLQENKQKLSFRHRGARELIQSAVLAAAEAKTFHDEMEALSARAMDWEQVEQLTESTIARVFSRS